MINCQFLQRAFPLKKKQGHTNTKNKTTKEISPICSTKWKQLQNNVHFSLFESLISLISFPAAYSMQT